VTFFAEFSAAKFPVKDVIQNADEDETSGDDDDFTDSESEMSEEDDSGSEEQTPTPKKVCTRCSFPLVPIAVMSHPICSFYCRLM
jgi:hypothetical protein